VKKVRIFRFVLLLFLIFGLTVGEAGPAENAPTQAPLLAKAEGDRDVSSSQQTIALEPFYLIQEKEAKVWIERIIVTLELDQSRRLTMVFNCPHQRSRIFDILISEPKKGPLAAKVQAALNQTLGEPAVTSAHLSRSFLLFQERK
jgi:hypothetical protein